MTTYGTYGWRRAGIIVGAVLLTCGILAWQSYADGDRNSASPASEKDQPVPSSESAHAGLRHYPVSWSPSGLTPPEDAPREFLRDDDFIKGAALGLYMELPELSYAQLFEEIRGLGATHVSVVVAWSMRDIRGVKVRPHPTETVPDERLRTYIRQARKAGLKVMLFPIVHVERRRAGEWRGKLAPAHPDRFWSEYEGFINHYAKIAQQEQVAIVSVGSELLTLESENERWAKLIKSVRAGYSGKLTYSANWDHFDHVTFWEHLDIAGMTGYFELSDDEQPSLEALRQTWEAATDVISTYPSRAGLPLILTEVGPHELRLVVQEVIFLHVPGIPAHP